MRTEVGGFSTDIFLTDAEVKVLCKPGAGADTCVWLVLGGAGWECCCHNRPSTLLDDDHRKKMVAQRDGCDIVDNLAIDESREVETGIYSWDEWFDKFKPETDGDGAYLIEASNTAEISSRIIPLVSDKDRRSWTLVNCPDGGTEVVEDYQISNLVVGHYVTENPFTEGVEYHVECKPSNHEQALPQKGNYEQVLPKESGD